MATGRHLVAESITPLYVNVLAKIADGLTVGDPRGEVDLGPIINQSQLDHITDIVERSVDAGARIVTGGTADRLFLRPTALADVATAGSAPRAGASTLPAWRPMAGTSTFRERIRSAGRIRTPGTDPSRSWPACSGERWHLIDVL
jgi:benzaldehyde dehydrogenase (NAD)